MNGAIDTSPVRQARIAGLCYLLVIAGGLFAEGVVRGSLIVPGDAAATARAIAGDEALWRWGLAVHLLYLTLALVVNVIVSRLFASASALLARLALVGAVVGVTIEAMSLVLLYLPLALAEEPSAYAGLSDGPALAYLATRLFSIGFGFALVFFAVFCVLVGVLIVRSRLVPRGFGVLMIVAGACYVVNTLALLLSPSLSRAINPAILLPILVAELSLAVWLLVKGVRREPVGG
jgi:hypothetical protein